MFYLFHHIPKWVYEENHFSIHSPYPIPISEFSWTLSSGTLMCLLVYFMDVWYESWTIWKASSRWWTSLFEFHDSFLCFFLHQMKPLCIYSLLLAYVLYLISLFSKGFLDDAVVKNSSANSGGSGEVGSTSGSGRSCGEGNGSLLQYSCLENPMDKATWQAAAHRVTKIWT